MFSTGQTRSGARLRLVRQGMIIPQAPGSRLHGRQVARGAAKRKARSAPAGNKVSRTSSGRTLVMGWARDLTPKLPTWAQSAALRTASRLEGAGRRWVSAGRAPRACRTGGKIRISAWKHWQNVRGTRFLQGGRWRKGPARAGFEILRPVAKTIEQHPGSNTTDPWTEDRCGEALQARHKSNPTLVGSGAVRPGHEYVLVGQGFQVEGNHITAAHRQRHGANFRQPIPGRRSLQEHQVRVQTSTKANDIAERAGWKKGRRTGIREKGGGKKLKVRLPDPNKQGRRQKTHGDRHEGLPEGGDRR